MEQLGAGSRPRASRRSLGGALADPASWLKATPYEDFAGPTNYHSPMATGDRLSEALATVRERIESLSGEPFGDRTRRRV
jgi:hypothetical protein